MKALLLNSRLGNLLQQRNLLLALVCVLLTTNLTQAVYSLFRNERIVIVPPDIRQEYWLDKKTVSASYLEEHALYFAFLLLETSPTNAAFNREIVLRNTVSQAYGPLKARLLEDEERLKKEAVTTSFLPVSVKPNPNDMSVEVTGDLLRYVGEKRISQSRESYTFSFVYRHGRLLIETFKLIRSEKK